ncbi:hypothetical protein P7K49_007279 [Saguinus oedipus]|uniref:UPF3 domain-containing protein n=1 Tax=Saguinus oedipus TaxID=9490 RepID=A0ABQ9VUF2_SAGOE|nr:hypothetical protein P7K49_007279 [Saguinus oedipus]
MSCEVSPGVWRLPLGVGRGPEAQGRPLPRGAGPETEPSAVEVQFYRDLPQRQPETPPTPSSGCGGGAGTPREEKRTALSKVVTYRLPQGLTKEQLEEQLHPLPAHDYFQFFAADLNAKTGSIKDDPEYKKFLETYCVEEEKTSTNPEILLGEMEAKTRELIARRTTPLLEYIKNRKLEKQRIREEKREERRRREKRNACGKRRKEEEKKKDAKKGR